MTLQRAAPPRNPPDTSAEASTLNASDEQPPTCPANSCTRLPVATSCITRPEFFPATARSFPSPLRLGFVVFQGFEHGREVFFWHQRLQTRLDELQIAFVIGVFAMSDDELTSQQGQFV